MPDDPMNDQDSAGTATEARDPESLASGESALDAQRRENESLHDRLLRTAAEFDNYRKRVDRDRRDQAEAATAEALIDFLPIIDNLERALNAPASGDIEGVRKGVELIHQQMVDLLRKRGVTPIEAVGADFDPRYHQAVVQEHSPDHRDGEVLEEFTRGYMLGDRLLRPAMVKVAKA
jgi:molecular chaperone GrpE